MNQHNSINYVELAAKDLTASKAFFSEAFDWDFVDYGSEYCAFDPATSGLDGGFYQADLASSAANGGALVVLYSKQLEETQNKVVDAGGTIVKPIFSFPGGRRFHFTEPSGNELAVWSDQ